MTEQRSDGTLYYLDRVWVPLKGEVRTLIMDEAHKSKYSVQLGADKMYYDVRDRYRWPGMKKDIAKWYQIFTKGRKTKPKRQNRARERKERERKVKSKTVRSQKDKVKVNKKVKVKVNPGKWHWKKHRKPNPKT
ncbi:putative reverse transcriptase domain-containing protein [Tanacetum coccineum]